MKRLVLLLVLGTLGLHRAGAVDQGTLAISKPAVGAQIVAVIEAQIAAFRGGDVKKAHGYATEALRLQIPAPAFGRMVQESYPEIWRNTRTEFGVVRDNGGRATVVVHVSAGETEAAYDYTLLKEEAGWRIGGVLRHEPRKGNSL